jgi:transglutaminase-like putative cysteine protease
VIQLCNRVVFPRIRVHRIPRGRQGTLATAVLMGRLIVEGARDFYVRQRAIQIFRRAGIPPKDRLGEVTAIFQWVKRNVRYTRDIFHTELLHSARRMLEVLAGDCDDMTILIGAMLMSTGHPVRIVLAGYRPNKPHSYSHVYPEAYVAGRWVALDATLDRPMGTRSPALWRSICELRKDGMTCSRATR